MKRMKKLFALLMTLAMVMGLSITGFAAASDTGSITVTGLVQENTIVTLYKVVGISTDGNSWEVEDWAKEYVTTTADPYVFNWSDLLNADKSGITPAASNTTSTGEITFSGLPLGAYLVVAAPVSDDSNTAYNPMGNITYQYGANNLITGAATTVYAKASNIPVTKTADDNFVAKGETVTFTITTTFPAFESDELTGASYKVVDTPAGLHIDSVESVYIGVTTDPANEVNSGSYTARYGIEENDEDPGKFYIDLSSQIGNGMDNAGKTVTITYKATVTEEDGYTNTVNVYKNETLVGTGEEKGYTADITITKYAADNTENTVEDNEKLSGAKFSVYKGTSNAGTKLYFTEVNGVYEYAGTVASEDNTDTIVTGTDGTVKVAGLDEGNYFFDETKAPDGYSINTEGVTIEITEEEASNASANISKIGGLVNTTIAELPSTGGMGTTLFTIAGCVIMISAAGLFFATRKKAN